MLVTSGQRCSNKNLSFDREPGPGARALSAVGAADSLFRENLPVLRVGVGEPPLAQTDCAWATVSTEGITLPGPFRAKSSLREDLNGRVA